MTHQFRKERRHSRGPTSVAVHVTAAISVLGGEEALRRAGSKQSPAFRNEWCDCFRLPAANWADLGLVWESLQRLCSVVAVGTDEMSRRTVVEWKIQAMDMGKGSPVDVEACLAVYGPDVGDGQGSRSHDGRMLETVVELTQLMQTILLWALRGKLAGGDEAGFTNPVVLRACVDPDFQAWSRTEIMLTA